MVDKYQQQVTVLMVNSTILIVNLTIIISKSGNTNIKFKVLVSGY